ncbi:hypothetical protein BASA81_003677 [Batrachochytrium salamandrivorans]|nr:hypothetical protein BASA81_003677 [Batrachochytrium salamandrivorans]
MQTFWCWCWGKREENGEEEGLDEPLVHLPRNEDCLLWQCPPTLGQFLTVREILALGATCRLMREYIQAVLLVHKQQLVNEICTNLCPNTKSISLTSWRDMPAAYACLLTSGSRIDMLLLDNCQVGAIFVPPEQQYPLRHLALRNLKLLSVLGGDWSELVTLVVERCYALYFHHVEPVLKHANLQVLHLKSQVLGAVFLDEDSGEYLTALTQLDVSSSSRVSSLVQHVCRHCPSLQMLDANYTDVCDEDLLGLRPSITRVTLNACCNVTDLVLNHLPYSVQVLNLSQTEITDSGLVFALRCNQLQVLFVSNCFQVTHLGLAQVVERNPHLCELGLSRCVQVRDLAFACPVSTVRCVGVPAQYILPQLDTATTTRTMR